MEKDKVRVAVAQIKLTPKFKKDIKKIKYFIKLARIKNADIICFPETSLKGKAISVSDHAIKEIFSECKKNSIWCIIGDYIK